MVNSILIVIIVTSLATYLSRFLGVVSSEKIKETSNYNFAYDESFFGDRDFKKYYKFHDKQLNRLINKISNKQIIKS